MRRSVLAVLLILSALVLAPAYAQVMQSMNYIDEVRHAQSLIAGATTDITLSHHIHYDLKLYDQAGQETTATYDIYRDPPLYDRFDIKAPNFQLTQVRNLRDHKTWLQSSGDKPLKITDIEQAFEFPQAAVKRFAQENITEMQPQELEGTPLLCANDDDGTAICFNPLIHLFAYAQMFNHTIMYDQWLPIGAHTAPGSIRIFQDKKLLVEATGTVEIIKKFPPGLMQIPDTPSQPEPGTVHKVLHYKPADISQMRYGNIAIKISVDEQGKVTRAEIADSDDKHLDGIARKFGRSLVMQPQIENGKPVPYDTVIYMEYYPQP